MSALKIVNVWQIGKIDTFFLDHLERLEFLIAYCLLFFKLAHSNHLHRKKIQTVCTLHKNCYQYCSTFELNNFFIRMKKTNRF